MARQKKFEKKRFRLSLFGKCMRGLGEKSKEAVCVAFEITSFESSTCVSGLYNLYLDTNPSVNKCTTFIWTQIVEKYV